MSENGAKVIAVIREIAAERPSYIYPGAGLYVARGRPGCPVGQALWRVGLIDADFERSELNDRSVTVFGAPPWNFDAGEIAWLQDFQEQADSRVRLGNAVAFASRP